MHKCEKIVHQCLPEEIETRRKYKLASIRNKKTIKKKKSPNHVSKLFKKKQMITEIYKVGKLPEKTNDHRIHKVSKSIKEI